jgi:hypothetical protein
MGEWMFALFLWQRFYKRIIKWKTHYEKQNGADEISQITENNPNPSHLPAPLSQTEAWGGKIGWLVAYVYVLLGEFKP